VFVTVGEGLLRPEVPPVRLTATIEAVIGAVFEEVSGCVGMELESAARKLDPDEDPQRRDCWRRKVLAVCDQWDLNEKDPSTPKAEPTTLDCDDHDEWEYLIEGLADLILHDRDYEMEDQFVDQPPEEGKAGMELMRIDKKYYRDIPNDLTDRQAKVTVRRLKRLLREVDPD
jgi:hypothetical protein